MDLRIFVEPQMGASYDDQLAIARHAEDAGFDAFFRSDHLMTFAGDGLPGPTDSWVTLGAIARETSRIRLGTMVTSMTFRYPGMLAITVAQVDAMSGGRVELGLGAGWFEQEHLAYAAPFPSTAERFERLDEQLAIVEGLWTTPVGERFSFTGRHYSIVDSPGLPKPVQSPRPPVIVGGSGPRKTPALVARYADEYNGTFLPVEQFATQCERVREACDAVGRDPSSVILSIAQTVCCGRDEAELARRAAAIGRTPELARKHALGGSPAEVVDRIGQYAAAGATRVYLQTLDMRDLDHVSLIASDVMPQVV